MSEAILQVTNLVKKIKGKTILDNISFEVGQGDCLALIGPNGAGKTTLMSCILGDKKASSGQVFIKGKRGKHKIKLRFSPRKYHSLTIKVKELIAFFQDISENGLSKEEIQALLQFKDDQYQQFADKLSGGQKRLLAFVLCLIGKPDILFLDEPTAGMDTTTRQRFWEIINDLKKSGVTILYSSHYIEEVEHTADRILVLHQGKLIRDTTPHAMRSEEKEKQVTLPSRFAPSLDKLADIYDVTEKRDVVTFMTKDIESVWSSLQAQGCRISDIEIQNKTLLDSLFDSTREDKS
ncbi:MAG: ABC transporter ATP-binding protein [Streptococcus salivarius]